MNLPWNRDRKHRGSFLRWGDLLLPLACLLALAADLFIERHVTHEWESLFGFYALYGFSASVLLVQLVKVMRWFVMRREDYYDDQ